ncbi:RsiV family protein [Salibacterium lacus]|uniref:RsiV family protein n=1 Tax=Salibacterium lacus TaxID=1898109 RepID=A0ABW5T4K3_9BACI
MKICDFPVSIQTYRLMEEPVFFPWIVYPGAEAVNQDIFSRVYGMFQTLQQDGYYQPGVTDVQGSFRVKNNQDCIASFTFSLFANSPKLAHPVEYMDSVTADVSRDKVYSLSEQFQPGSNWQENVNRIIEAQIKERDIPLLNGFPGVSQDQKYYLADKSLVIYFDKYDITPGYAGFPMFPISGYSLQSVVRESSPLGMMLSGG